MKRTMWRTAALLLSAVAATAWAAGPTDYDRVRFRVQVQETVANDWAVATLKARAEGDAPAVVSEAINRDMAWALERARAVPALKTATGNYRVVPVHHKQELRGWRGEQVLTVEGGDVGALAALVGQLQARLQVVAMGFRVSPERRVEVERRLQERVLRAYAERAARIAETLGATGYRLVELGLDGSGDDGPRPYATLRMEAGGAPVAVAEGETTLSAGASALIELRGASGALRE